MPSSVVGRKGCYRQLSFRRGPDAVPLLILRIARQLLQSGFEWDRIDSHAMPLSPGEQFGHYKLLSMIGEGGMGTVYRALDAKPNRPVAIKFLSADLADTAARRRFQRE